MPARPGGSRSGHDQDRSTTSDIEMTQQTPGAPTIHPMAGTQARPFRPTPATGSAAARRAVVHVLYVGRKRRSGRTQNMAGEHVDLIVPDQRENEQAVEEFLDPVGQVGMTDEQRAAILAGHNADTMHIAGHHYHFVGGEVTDVHGVHIDWLMAHPVYAFEKVSS